jgi:hypothetical protein
VALPDRLPEPPDDFETHSAAPERPSWLVGAEEGAATEIEGIERGKVAPTRPMLSEVPRAASPPAPAAAAPATPPRPVAWTAAGNSVPRLTQIPEPVARIAEPAAEPLEPITDPLDEPEPRGTALTAKVGRSPAARTLEEPWWLILGESIGGDRRLQIVIGAALVLGLTLMFWPRGDGPGISLRELRRNPDRWEGQSVRVNGRVGEVFPLGSGYVFNLHQGRDTIVVFTRGAQPSPRARVHVTGEVSAGYLDGRARLAILETPQVAAPPSP